MRIAILGATSHIAKNLIVRFLSRREYEMRLFARNADGVRRFLYEYGGNAASVGGFEEFSQGEYDAVINCVGIADPLKQRGAGIELFRITEHFDELCLSYIQRLPSARYINFSSGAVYGTTFNDGVDESCETKIAVNFLKTGDFYRIAKINTEAKHRALKDFSIIDIRVFSFYSRYIDRTAGFLLAEMLRSIETGVPFRTTRSELVRDYIAPDDMYRLIEACLDGERVNDVVDACSLAPVGKLELVSCFEKRYGMHVDYTCDSAASPTGDKNQYFSINHRAQRLFGFTPLVKSIETVLSETDAIFNKE